MFRYLAEDIAFLLIKHKWVDIEKREECVRLWQRVLFAASICIVTVASLALICSMIFY